LRDQADATGDPSVRAWSWAMQADWLLLTGDPAAAGEARRALDALPDEPVVGDTVHQYARARLLRVSAAGARLDPSPGELDRARRLHDEAVTRMLRCGFTDEASASGAVFAGWRALLVGEDLLEGYQRVRDVRASFPTGPDRGWPVILDFLLACLAFVV